jgi:DNA modification methylase
VKQFTIYNMDVTDALRKMPAESVDCVMTSPPYWGLRDYGVKGQIGLEPHPQEYIKRMVNVFQYVRHVLKPTGSVWLNMGDTYGGSCGGWGATKKSETGIQDVTRGYFGSSKQRPPQAGNFKENWLKPKQKLLMPHRLAIAMQDDGWILRNDVVWHKPSHMPSSVRDRLSNSFEFVFHFVKQRKYYYDLDAIRVPCQQSTIKRNEYGTPNPSGIGVYSCGRVREPGSFMNPSGKNPSDMWSINPKPYPEAHFACYPPALCEKPLKATCPKDGVVLDPFIGSGTTLMVAQQLGLNGIGIELNPEYIPLIKKRLFGGAEPLLNNFEIITPNPPSRNARKTQKEMM